MSMKASSNKKQGRKAKSGGVPPNRNSNGSKDAVEETPHSAWDLLRTHLEAFKDDEEKQWLLDRLGKKSPIGHQLTPEILDVPDMQLSNWYVMMEIISASASIVSCTVRLGNALANLYDEGSPRLFHTWDEVKEVDIDEDSAEKYVRIAQHPILSQEHWHSQLPPDPYALAILADLPFGVLWHALISVEIDECSTVSDCEELRDTGSVQRIRTMKQQP
jgi:hypothetical protein